MKRPALTLVALLGLASAARAQEPAKDVLAPYIRKSYTALSRDIVAAVQLMPEQDFTFRPAGVASEVRTFGEIVAHIAYVTGFSCTMGDGKPATSPPTDSLLYRDKGRLIALLNETDARCNAYLATLNDASLSDIIKTESGKRVLQAARGNSMFFAIAHGNEHYGNLVTYLRAKGIVPPPAAAQAGFLSLATPPAAELWPATRP